MRRATRQHGPACCTLQWLGRSAALALALLCPTLANAAERAVPKFEDDVRPILEDRCFACHGGGIKKGGVDLEAATATDRKLWWAVLKNLRSGIMPPAGKPQPSDHERQQLENWIKFRAFGIDRDDPDPGRITVHRLNRVEYRNTIRDLIGVDFDATGEFPPDDAGHGFDNIGDVLTLSPLLLEKYLTAAKIIVSRVVPMVPKVVADRVIPGRDFVPAAGAKASDASGTPWRSLSYYEPATVSHTVTIEHEGDYRLLLDLSAHERFVDGMNDYNRCRLVFRADGEELLRQEFSRLEGRLFHFEFPRAWKAGPKELSIEVQPLTPGQEQVRSLTIRVQSVTVRGPHDPRYWVRPPGYERFFPGEVPGPEDTAGRRRYTREILGQFAARAYRHPVDDLTRDRLAALAEAVFAQPGQTFESGVAQAMAAILTSPRFLFREEAAEPEQDTPGRYPPVDEYDLASRLSYFLWSSMPDEELFRLAGRRQLRANLPAQVERMLADPRSAELFRNFVGQWLQVRDIESVAIDARAVITRDEPPDPESERRRARFRELIRKAPEEQSDADKKELLALRSNFGRGFRRFREFQLTTELRQAMRRETEMLFEHIVRGDRSLLELLDSNYTFLNERLAKHYGIEGVQGEAMRRVELPAASPRGGVLTQGTILAITSNPDRTSPVKRGLFILENILGSPPAPPPANVPPLEEAEKKAAGRTPSLRESLVLHRDVPACTGCHARMDPLGLALEQFNALGRWRDEERAGPIDASGTLITGEPFADARDLKRLLIERHHREFYRCLTEKMLTYALGRGLEDYDVQAVDRTVAALEMSGGRPSALLAGIIESAPFQKRRRTATEPPKLTAPGPNPRRVSTPTD